jgi:antitoxin CcdA
MRNTFRETIAPPPRRSTRSTNLSLDAQLVEQAKQLGVNLSRACEEGLKTRIKEELECRWRDENKAAIASSNAYTEKEGLPLAAHRRF